MSELEKFKAKLRESWKDKSKEELLDMLIDAYAANYQRTIDEIEIAKQELRNYSLSSHVLSIF